jgi:putative addiction module component (TIGR02574 family)
MAPVIADILKLSIPERILLVEAIWDSIASDAGQSYVLNSDQIKILEEELEAYAKNPDEGSSWEEVKRRITGK